MCISILNYRNSEIYGEKSFPILLFSSKCLTLVFPKISNELNAGCLTSGGLSVPFLGWKKNIDAEGG